VTGGTRGIGKAISLALAAEGAAVYALYNRDRRNADALEEEASQRGLFITAIRGDLSKDEKFHASVSRITDACDRVDILVHGAATGVFKPAMELTEKHLRWTIELNVISVHRLTRALISRIPRGGRIIGLTSPGGARVIPFYTAIGASKGALESLLRHYARELGPSGITVNLVCPGLVMTDAVEHFPDLVDRARITRTQTPTGALTVPEQVAAAVCYLCSPAASQITGETLVMDGGKGLLS
jgi:enoyl-[acyl-carrier protein] reductase III